MVPKKENFKAELRSRLGDVRRHLKLSQSEMDKLLSIGRGSWQRYESVGQVPGSQVIALLIDQGLNANWILTGQGPMLLSDFGKEIKELRDEYSEIKRAYDVLVLEALDRKNQPNEEVIVKVVGLAESEQKGWQALTHTKMWVEAPTDIGKDSGFAVIAVGDSMRPAGIRDGTICFCSEKRVPQKGDIVFVEKEGGMASVKLYAGEHTKNNNDYIALHGWSSSDGSTPNGNQERYTLEVPKTDVKHLAVVVYIKLSV